VSGKVTKIDSILMQNGSKAQAVIIESDGQQTIDPSIKAPVINSDEDLIKAVHDSGLVGLGGAGFPTHIKLNPNPEVKAKIDSLLINAAECEPYLTPDVREILEDSENIVEGMKVVSKLLGVKQAVIGIEDNKPEAIKLMTELLAQVKVDGVTFKVETLPSRYPQGAEKVLIDQCTGRQVPPGKLPSDVGVVVMNVTSVAVLANYLATGMPLTTKRLTVDGSAVNEPKNVRVPIGTSTKDVIEFCGGYKGTPYKIISGGPMMGMALMTDDFPILKQNNGILIFDKQDAELAESSACIRCGRCVNACPMNLMPTKLEAYTHIGNTDELKKLNIMNCMECGCCSFVCPADRKLVQSIRLGKGLVRNAGN
jgi:electron transport complex protein RnfC